MKLSFPKNDEKYVWTKHVCDKMRYYNLSEQRVRRVLRSPKRVEDGIAPNTIAVMDFSGSSKKPQEIWVMYQCLNPEQITNSKKNTRLRRSLGGQAKHKVLNSKFLILNSRKRIISAWRYPGRSPIGKKIEVPEEVMEDLGNYT